MDKNIMKLLLIVIVWLFFFWLMIYFKVDNIDNNINKYCQVNMEI